jgi:hypothetical protein
MENLPKNVINKIMFYLSHPVAELIEGTSIMEYMAMRLNRKHLQKGTPFRCGMDDFLEGGPFQYRQSKIQCQQGLASDEQCQYAVGYLHSNVAYYSKLKLAVDWSIRDNKIKWEHDFDYDNNSDDSDSD